MKLKILIANLSLFSSLCWVFPAHALQPTEDALIELYQRVDELQQDVNKLRGQNQELKYSIDNLKKQQKEGFIELDDRYEQLSQKVASAPTDASPSKDSAADNTPPAKTDEGQQGASAKPNAEKAATDEESYKLAYALLKDDPYRAIVAFKDFLNKYPSSKLAANAQYWIGESYYSLEKYPEAKNRFLKVLKDYKGSSKEADAALKLGYTFYAMKEWATARKTLEDVVKFFPGSREAELAKGKLASLEKAGN